MKGVLLEIAGDGRASDGSVTRPDGAPRDKPVVMERRGTEYPARTGEATETTGLSSFQAAIYDGGRRPITTPKARSVSLEKCGRLGTLPFAEHT